MYKKLIETKVIKTIHEVTIYRNSSTVFSIIEDLKNVPLKAKFVDWDENDDERILVFQEEKKA